MNINSIINGLYRVATKIIGKELRTLLFYSDGRNYEYLLHPYNATWDCERCIEVPIIMDLVKRVAPSTVLEIGNVIQHYYVTSHQVIDLHEKGYGVQNADILNFHPDKQYDLIIGISTLEHIGKDDETCPSKCLEAIEHIKSLLTLSGQFIATIPIGYNEFLDKRLNKVFDSVKYMKRYDSLLWTECKEDEAMQCKYNRPYRGATAVAICTMAKK